ncbi:MAG: hypothetical protein JO033_17135 [Acidobacteriaceae bacterium]|nr:hypothetical protein [Acidobacteriaceae bacterium]MBV9497767.1 hypothetical protein [Acidobacteriaceae bacterium]
MISFLPHTGPRLYIGIVLIVCVAAQSIASDVTLAAQIEQLLNKELSEEVPDPATLSEVRQIFREHGIPTVALVGQEAAEDYIVLTGYHQPVTFLQQILPALKAAVDNREMPVNDYLYLSAQVRERQVEESSNAKPANPELRDEIEELFQTDQSARQKIDFDPKKMEEVDVHDAVQEHAIFANYGVPTYSMVGPRAAKDFIVLIEHQPVEFMEQVLPKLKQNVDMGQADPADYASMFDRVQTDQKKPQRYGMNFVCTPEGKLAPSPIEDVAHLDRRRAEVGLLPMRLYAKLVIQNSPQGFCEKIAASGKQTKH